MLPTLGRIVFAFLTRKPSFSPGAPDVLGLSAIPHPLGDCTIQYASYALYLLHGRNDPPIPRIQS